jgi:hypothetical protein
VDTRAYLDRCGKSRPTGIRSLDLPARISRYTTELPGPQLPSSAEVKERVELYLYTPSGLSWPVLGRTLSLLLTLPCR